MNRRSFLTGLAATLFLPKAIDRYRWKNISPETQLLVADHSIINPAYQTACYEVWMACHETAFEVLRIDPIPRRWTIELAT